MNLSGTYVMTREEFISLITIDGKIQPAYSKESYVTAHYADEFDKLTSQYNGNFKHKFRCLIAGFEGRCPVCNELTQWSTTGTWKQFCELHHPQNQSAPVECIDDYTNGMSLASVAVKHNTSKYLVKKLLKTHNIHIRTTQEQKLIDDGASEVIVDYNSGLTISEISTNHNISLARVRYCIRDIPKRSLSQSILEYRKRNPRNPSTYKVKQHYDFSNIEEQYKTMSIPEIAAHYQCHVETIYKKLTNLGLRKKRSRTTEPERIVQAILDKHNIDYITHDRTQITPKELDIFIPDHNLAIEVNGLYWHSTSIPKVDTRHIDKFMECKSRGIKLLQFADSMILNKPDLVESMILSKLGKLPIRIMARKCKIVNLSITQANRLFEQWHYQGQTTNGAKCLGLMHDNKIVAALAYTIKDNECRIERFACELMTNVVGGYSKLESEVLRQHNVTQLTTFSLGLISDGSLYSNNGYTTPGYSTKPEFYVTDGETLYNRQRFMKTKMAKLFGNGFNPDKTEWENICDNGLLLFFGAGITKWVKQSINIMKNNIN